MTAWALTSWEYSRVESFTTGQYRHSAAHPEPSSRTIVRRSHVGQVTGNRTLTGSMPETRRRVFVRLSSSSAKSAAHIWWHDHSTWSSRYRVRPVTLRLTGLLGHQVAPAGEDAHNGRGARMVLA